MVTHSTHVAVAKLDSAYICVLAVAARWLVRRRNNLKKNARDNK